jgi:hypothetical protein
MTGHACGLPGWRAARAALSGLWPLALALVAWASPAGAQQRVPQPQQPAPAQGYPAQGQPASGQPASGQPAYGQPQYGQPQGGGSATEQRLKEAEERDSKRGLEWLWIQAEGGVTHLNLQTFKGGAENPLVSPTSKTSSAGPMGGLALGVRLVFLTLGVRGRVAWLADHQYVSIDPEIGLHIPMGNIEPYVFVGGGYSSLGGVATSTADVKVNGGNARLGLGLDYYVSRHFTVGGIATGDVTILSRSQLGAAPAGAAPTSEDALRKADGSGVGLAIAGSLVLGVHY